MSQEHVPAFQGQRLSVIEMTARLVEKQLSQYRLITIDGGGVRGVFPAKVIEILHGRIHDKLQGLAPDEPTREYIKGLSIARFFEGGFTGTSTGSLIGLGLAMQGPIPPSKIIEVYERNAAAIFPNWNQCPSRGWCCYPGFWSWEAAWAAHKPCGDGCRGAWCQRLWCVTTSLATVCGCCGCCYNCFGLCGPRYGRGALDHQIDGLYGTALLEQAFVPVQVTTYNLKNGRIQYLGSTDPSTSAYTLADAARCSSAAPTYLGGVRLVQRDGRKNHQEFIGVDGGLFENNPAQAGLRQAVKFVRAYAGEQADESFPVSLDDFFVVSLGTGQPGNPKRLPHLQHAGLLTWAKPAIDIGIDGGSDATHTSMEGILNKDKYHRLQGALKKKLIALDDASNVPALLTMAEGFCQQSAGLGKVVEYIAHEHAFTMNLRQHLGGLSPNGIGQVIKYFIHTFATGTLSDALRAKANERAAFHQILLEQQRLSLDEFQTAFHGADSSGGRPRQEAYREVSAALSEAREAIVAAIGLGGWGAQESFARAQGLLQQVQDHIRNHDVIRRLYDFVQSIKAPQELRQLGFFINVLKKDIMPIVTGELQQNDEDTMA